MDAKKIMLAGAIVIIVIAILVSTGKFNLPSSSTLSKSAISEETAKKTALDFVEKNLVQPGTDVEIKEITEEGGLFKIIFVVGKQEVVSYLTQDGKKFFPEAMDIAEVEKKAVESKKKEEEQNKAITKSDKPEVDLYVMSFCPFGNKAEDTIAPVYALLKDKVNFNFRYIVSSNGDAIQSLHGQKEVDQNMREACVLKDYGKGSWMNFVTYVNDSCGSDGSCWEAGAKTLNIDVEKVSSCVKSSGLALMQADEKSSNEAGASGSPTMIINGSQTSAVYKYGNAEAYKEVICGAFNEAPAECSQTLNVDESTSQGGSC